MAKKDKAFMVFTKGNRTMIVQSPSRKQVRRYDRKGWARAATVKADGEDTFRDRLADLLGAAAAPTTTA